MVSNGQIANATTFNNAFVSRTTDTSTTGKLDLNNSGSTVVTDAQLVINNILVDLANAETDINNLESSRVFNSPTATDNAIVRFDGTTGQSIQNSLVTISDTGSMIIPENLTVQGNLTIEGTTTSLDTVNLEVTDKNITVNKDGSDITAEGAGITVDRVGTDGSLVYEDALASKWKAGALGSEIQLANVSSAQTLTNKTIVAANNTITTAASGNLTSTNINAALAELQGDIDAIGSPANYILKSLVTTKGDLIAATASATVARLGVGTNNQVLTADSAEATGLKWADATGGSGGGAKNLITNGSADASLVTIFVPYADAAASRLPVDGIGGSPTVTTTITSTTPLDGTKSYLLTKPASNVQGQGWSVPFTVDLAYRAKVLTINFDYIVNSGTFVAGSSTTDSDVIWYIYDVTNAQLIEPSSIKMLARSTTISDRFSASFQTSATGSSYRLIAHVATTSALAYELEVDNVTVSPSAYVFGTPITDWTTFTPTGSWTTNTTYQGRWRRVGQNMEMQARATLSGAPNAVTLTVNIPSGFSIDTSVNQVSNRVGYGYIQDTGVNNYPAGVLVATSTSVQPVTWFTNSTYASNGAINNTLPITFGNTDFVDFYITVAIVGWSSSVQTSDQTDTRVVGFSALTNASTTFVAAPTNTTVNFNVGESTHGTYNNGASQFTAPVAGRYSLSAEVLVDVTAFTSANALDVAIFKNGSLLKVSRISVSSVRQDTLSISVETNLNSGDVVDVRGSKTNASNTVVINASNGYSIFRGSRLSGPSAIAASEKVFCEYTTGAGQALTGAAYTRINFNTVVRDSHNAVTTGASWVFTAPRADVYEVEVCCAPATQVASSQTILDLFKNTVSYRRITRQRVGAGTDDQPLNGVTSLYLLAGETVDLRVLVSTGQNLTAANSENWITVKSIGGV